MCPIVEECVMEAESRVLVQLAETVASKIDGIESACEMLDINSADYFAAKQYLVHAETAEESRKNE